DDDVVDGRAQQRAGYRDAGARRLWPFEVTPCRSAVVRAPHPGVATQVRPPTGGMQGAAKRLARHRLEVAVQAPGGVVVAGADVDDVHDMLRRNPVNRIAPERQPSRAPDRQRQYVGNVVEALPPAI